MQSQMLFLQKRPALNAAPVIRRRRRAGGLFVGEHVETCYRLHRSPIL
jgi:hypothetical protein